MRGNTLLINNRQGGRRRGRGGQRPQGMPGNSGGNRDTRNRGNAAQLLEKYKGLARDAQLAGDRVQTEYYLQFADHYFRVLEENRSRFEEQNQRRRRDDDDDDDDGDDEISAEGNDDEIDERPRRRERQERPDRGERRPARVNGNARNGGANDGEGGDSLPASMLPPAIGATADEDDADQAPKPRRRARKPRDEDEGTSADAA